MAIGRPAHRNKSDSPFALMPYTFSRNSFREQKLAEDPLKCCWNLSTVFFLGLFKSFHILKCRDRRHQNIKIPGSPVACTSTCDAATLFHKGICACLYCILCLPPGGWPSFEICLI